MILQVDHVFQHPLSTAPRIRYSMLIRYPLESTRLTLPKTNRHSTWQEDVGAPRPKRKTHLPIPVFSGVYVYIYIYLCICFEGSEGFKNCSFPFPPTFHFQSWRPQKPRNGFTEAPLTLSLKRAANRSQFVVPYISCVWTLYIGDFPNLIGSMGLVDLPTVHSVDFYGTIGSIY